MKTSLDDAPQQKRALTLVFDGIEEIEALAPVDLMRRAGIDVTMASVGPSDNVTGRNGISFSADKSLDEIDPSSFDLIFLPGGSGSLDLIANPAVRELLQSYDKRNALIAAICAAPKVLAAAGILENRPATSHASVRGELPRACDDPIVISDHIITSQGAGTAVPFGLELVRLLAGDSMARAVADSIHA